MKHLKPMSAQSKELDWGLNGGLDSFTNLINAIITLLNAIGILKGSNETHGA